MTEGFTHERSTKPFPIRASTLPNNVRVDRASIPVYMAEIAYRRALAGAPVDFKAPTLQEIMRDGGFDPVEFMDLIAGGDGLGTRWTEIHVLGASPIRQQLSIKPLNGAALTGESAVAAFQIDASAMPFVVSGAPVTDGTGVEASFVPRYMASIALRQFQRTLTSKGQLVPITLDMIARQGGFHPNTFFDLLAGGDGQGLAYMQAHAHDSTAIAKRMAKEDA